MFGNLGSRIRGTIYHRVICPPNRPSWRLVPHSADYGHAYLYEEIFCRSTDDIRSVNRLCGDSPGTVLDLAGGAGRVAIGLAEQGKRVVLVDNSRAMLARAEQHLSLVAPQVRGRVEVACQDMRALELPHSFSHIFSVNHGLEHLESERSIIETLGRVKQHLAVDGVFYAGLHYLPHWEKSVHWNKSGWLHTDQFQWHGRLHHLWGRVSRRDDSPFVTWEHAVSRNGLRFKHLRTSIVVLPQDIWIDLFRQAGLCVEACYGGWDRQSICSSSPTLVIQAKKKS